MRSLAEVLGAPDRDAWPVLVRLWALSFGALVVWSRLGVLLHETAGHALVWVAGGGRVTGVEVSLFGGGATWLDPGACSRCPLFLFQMAGIFVNLALGLGAALALAALRRARSESPGRALAEHLLACGAVVNLAGATHYTVLGAFYEFGDPAPYPWLWGPALALLIFVTPVTFYLWAGTLRPLMSGAGGPRGCGSTEVALARSAGGGRRKDSPDGRDLVRQPQGVPASQASNGRCRPGGPPLGLSGLIVVSVPLAAYVVALSLESRVKGTNFRALQAEGHARARAVEEEKTRRLAEWRAEHGDETPPPDVTEVTEEDIKRPFPLTAVVLGLDAVFLGAALFTEKSGAARDVPVSVPWLAPLGAAAVALLLCQVLF